MIEGLKPYPNMKDSGVPWIGRVPEHWEVRRIRDVAMMVVSNVDKHSYEGEVPVRLCNYVDVYRHDVIRPEMEFMPATATTAEVNRFRLQQDDVLITKDSETWTDIGVPAYVSASSPDLVCGYHLAILRPHATALDGHYLFHAMQSKEVAHQLHVEATGVTRFGLSHSAIRSTRITLPPLAEQIAIKDFLRRADYRVRLLIRSKQKLITLLEEQKQAIIHRAVTCGLDPSIRLRPSGQEWIGDIPSHWDLLPNRALLRLKKEIVGTRSGDFVLLSLTKRGIIARDMENPEGKFPTSFDTYQVIEPGDFVFCLFDIDETPRAVGLSSLHGMITGAYTRFACDPSIAEWVYLFYLAMDNGKRLKPLYTGLRKVITKSRFLGAKIPMPPPEERIRLVAEVEHSTRGATDAISRAQREIDLLKEFRTRLISDVVTGRLDVRDAAARLPADDLEGDDPLDDTDTDGEEDDDSPIESGAEDGDGG